MGLNLLWYLINAFNLFKQLCEHCSEFYNDDFQYKLKKQKNKKPKKIETSFQLEEAVFSGKQSKIQIYSLVVLK